MNFSRAFSVLLFAWAILFAPGKAFAVTSVGSPVQSTTAIINRIINSTPGMQTVVTGAGVNVSASAEASIAARGLTIPVGTTATTAITAGRLAGLAARAIRFGSFIGIATVVIPYLAEKSGITVCPPPAFFCKPGADVAAQPTSGGWFTDPSAGRGFGTGQAGCDYLYSVASEAQRVSLGRAVVTVPSNGVASCIGSVPDSGRYGLVRSFSAICPSGSTRSPDGFSCTTAGPAVAAPESDIGDAIEKQITNNPARISDVYHAIQPTGVPMFAPSDPVTVTATPPATTQPVATVTTVKKPDGSTDTVITETRTNVKPVVTGTNLGDTKIDYPTTTTTTTSTTNDLTHQQTTTTSVTNNYSTPVADPISNTPSVTPVALPTSPSDAGEKPSDFPTDYNREVTQQSILQKITDFTGPITATAPDGQKDLDTIKTKNDDGTAVVGGISEGSTGLHGWFPTIATTACRDPQVPLAIGSGNVAVPICDKVNIFSQFISAVICVFALFGCVREVQAALKA